MNRTYLKHIKSWYTQKRQAGSCKIPGLDELQIIELEHDDLPDAEIGAPEIETTDAPAQEPTHSFSISSSRRRTSKCTRTSLAAGEKHKKRSFKGSSSEVIPETTATRDGGVSDAEDDDFKE